MILYLSTEESDTYVQSCRVIDDLPVGVPIVILKLAATQYEMVLCELAIDRAQKFFNRS